MTHVFEKRRNRLRAMKELSESYLPPEKAILCPACGVESPREDVERALSVSRDLMDISHALDGIIAEPKHAG